MLFALVLLAATVRGPADIPSLSKASDAVVYAQVASTSSAYGEGGGLIFTTVKLKPMEVWKGQPGAEVRVLVEGGVVGDLDQIVQGSAVFKPGEEVVVFLRRRAESVYSVYQMALGKFSVGAAAKALPKRAMRDRSRLDCQSCKPGEPDDFSLDELRKAVLESARK
jgi:hypothetical protein